MLWLERAGGMAEPQGAASGDVSLHNFSARLWEQLIHFHVMRLTDSLFLWVGATPHLRNLAVAMCSRYVSVGGAWAGRGWAFLGADYGAGPKLKGLVDLSEEGPGCRVTSGDHWGGALEQERLVGMRLVTCSPEGLQLSSELSLNTSGWSPLGFLTVTEPQSALHHLGLSAQPLSSEPTKTRVLLAQDLDVCVC